MSVIRVIVLTLEGYRFDPGSGEELLSTQDATSEDQDESQTRANLLCNTIRNAFSLFYDFFRVRLFRVYPLKVTAGTGSEL